MVSKTYFDRGPWDRQTLFYTSGCYSGPPTFYANSRKQVCCCVDCCDGYNNLVDCFIPECCGDKIIYSPYDTVCFCCPNKVNFCCNNCGLLGLKSGEPLCVHSQYSCLQPGTGEAFAELMNQARQVCMSTSAVKTSKYIQIYHNNPPNIHTYNNKNLLFVLLHPEQGLGSAHGAHGRQPVSSKESRTRCMLMCVGLRVWFKSMSTIVYRLQRPWFRLPFACGTCTIVLPQYQF